MIAVRSWRRGARSPVSLLTLVLHLFFASPTVAQDKPPAATPVPAPEKATRLPRLWSFNLTASNFFDSNINHTADKQRSYGIVFGTGVHYQNRSSRPMFVVDYEAATHRYAGSDIWDRVSQNLRASFERRLPGRWNLETTGEISFKGSSEDRELSDQYVLRPRVEYRLNQQDRVRVYAAYRLKRYTGSPDRDATNRYVGVEFRRQFRSGDRVEAGYRHEANNAKSPRNQYRRRTGHLEYVTLLGGRDALTLEIKYRSQFYKHRLVEIDDARDLEAPRQDHRWVPSAFWSHRLREDLDLRLLYAPEVRFSNDPRREFSAHLLGVTFFYHW